MCVRGFLESEDWYWIPWKWIYRELQITNAFCVPNFGLLVLKKDFLTIVLSLKPCRFSIKHLECVKLCHRSHKGVEKVVCIGSLTMS